MSFFGVGANPFGNPIGMKIEKATSESVACEDWTLNMEICDLISHTEDGPRDGAKAIRKRLTAQPKNYAIVMYTLTILETCVKNCGKRFHVFICSKDFVQELVKLIGVKNDPPQHVQDKVLSLIQGWAEAFKHQPELAGVSQVFAELRHKGINFPPLETDTPIVLPQRPGYDVSPALSASPNRRAAQPPPPDADTALPLEGEQPARHDNHGGQVTLSADQKAKLLSELDLVEANGKVLTEMMNAFAPANEQPEDLQLLQDLHATCRAMQERVVALIERVDDDLLTADLLRVNDDLNNIFVRYERHMTKTITSATTVPPGAATSAPRGPERLGSSLGPVAAVAKHLRASPKVADEAPPIIDFGSEEDLAASTTNKMAGLSVGRKTEDFDFDLLAQSRTTTTSFEAANTNEAAASPALGSDVAKLSDFDEMEQWLKQNQPSGGASSVSSSDFDRFLASRAAAADSLPSFEAAVAKDADAARGRDEKKDDVFLL